MMFFEKLRFSLFGFLIVFLFTGFGLSAQSEKIDTLVVGLAGNQPFVIDADRSPSGISVDIWKELADQTGWSYEFEEMESVDKGIEAVYNGEIDVLVGPLSITSERLKNIDFSQPYFQSSLSILSRPNEGLWAYIAPLFSYKLLIAVGGFLFLLSIVGTLFWLAERNRNPEQFPKNPIRGIGNGMWLAVVTMSTVGYGDLAPRSTFGRFLAGTWIILTIIFATSMIAGIASVLTKWGNVTTIHIVEDLAGKKVAVLRNSSAEEFVSRYEARLIRVNSLQEAIQQLDDGNVDALIFDRPQLEFYASQHPENTYHLSTAEYERQNYGFAFSMEDKRVYELNMKLLKLSETRELQQIVDRYLKTVIR